jgi:phospholipid/cholesterol/gamma-HCH transport system substrate-binding protein
MTVVVILAVLFLQRPAILSRGFVVHMNVQNAHGLGKGDAVQFRGVRVGTVNDIRFKPDHLVLDISINGAVAVPSDSRFVIQSGGVLSGNIVSIQPGTSTKMLKNGTVVSGGGSPGFGSLLSGGTGIEKQIQDVLSSLQSLPRGKMQSEVEGVLANLLAASEDLDTTLKQNSGRLGTFLKNAAALSGDNKTAVSATIASLRTSAGELEGTLNDTRKAVDRTQEAAAQLNDVLRNLRGGKGTLGQLLNNDQVYNKLNATLDNLNALVEDIRKNPGRYLSVRIF